MKRLGRGWAAIAACALTLVGCGKVGTLDQPAPLYGEKAKAEYKAQKAAAQAAAAKAKKDDGPPDALPGAKPYDPYIDPGPSRSNPVPGQNPSPFGQPARSGLPDPFNDPR
jgi:hypothetical protein